MTGERDLPAAQSAMSGGYTQPVGYPSPYGSPYWTGPPTPAPAPGRVLPVVLTVLMVLTVGGYALAGILSRDAWLTGPPRDGVHVTLAASTFDGSSPSAAALGQAQAVVKERLRELGVTGTDVVVSEDNLIVTAPGEEADVAAVIRPAQLRLRSVAQAIPVDQLLNRPGSVPPTPITTAPPGAPRDKQTAAQRELRQSGNQSLLLLLAVPFQAQQCGEDDLLAGLDDPNLPLVTCSTDGGIVYVLDRTLVGAQQISTAAARTDNGRHVVNLQLNPEAAQLWANFTRANVGDRVAITLDTEVINAPRINEEIRNGRVQISGNFSAEQARELAAALQTPPLPLALSVTSSTPQTVPGQPGSTSARVAMVGFGAVVALLVIGVSTYLLMRRYRPIPDQAADVTRYTS